MTITSNDIVTVLGALGILIAAIATAYSTIIAARMKAVAATAAETLATMKVVEGQGNSAATKAAGIIESQEKQMALLRETIETQKQTAEKLARTVAAHATEQLLAKGAMSTATGVREKVEAVIEGDVRDGKKP